MKVWHRIRHEVAGALRSLRYDLVQRHHRDRPRGRFAVYVGMAALFSAVSVAMGYAVTGGGESPGRANGQPALPDFPIQAPSATPVATPGPIDTVGTAPGHLSAPATERGQAPPHPPTWISPGGKPSPTRSPRPSSPSPSATPSHSPTDSPSPTPPTTPPRTPEAAAPVGGAARPAAR